MNKLLKYLVLPAVLFISACSSNSQHSKMHSQENYAHHNKHHCSLTTDHFRAQLAKNYVTHSDSNGHHYSLGHCKHFAKKSAMLNKRYDVAPDKIYSRHNNVEREELLAARMTLDRALQEQSLSPKKLADLQFYFDCWIEQDRMGSACKHPHSCKRKFHHLEKMIYQGKHCKTDYVIEFGKHCNVSHAGKNMITAFASEHGNCHERVLVVGPLDKARKVSDMLVADGIEQDRIKITIKDCHNVEIFLDCGHVKHCFTHHKKSHHAKTPHHMTHETMKHEASKIDESHVVTTKEIVEVKPNISGARTGNTGTGAIIESK